jgi:hypothetical protein
MKKRKGFLLFLEKGRRGEKERENDKQNPLSSSVV